MPYIISLKVLQEEVPPPPFSVVKGVVESELCASLDSLFATFDPTPVGSASIGAVHIATLKSDGRRVAVKVQYPEAQKFFALDFATILFFFEIINPMLVEVVKAQQKMFSNEFDYRKESDNLRKMCTEVKGKFRNLNFPEPYDALHPNLPPSVRARGGSLVTAKVLVMDVCEGKTITKLGKQLVAQLAASQNMTVEDLTAQVRRKMLDPNFVETVVGKRIPSEAEFAVFLSLLRAKDLVRNLSAFAFNWSLGLLLSLPPLEYVRSALPPNGPRLLRFLYDVHGFCLFELGVFNPDPHAGNVMLDEATGVVSLLDYGQLVAVDEMEARLYFARFIVAIDDRDVEGVVKYWVLLGNEFVWNETGEVNPPNETFACACFHFGGAAGMREGLKILGFKSISEVMGKTLLDKINITKTDAKYGMLQRSGFCLSGVGQQVGVGGISTAKMLRPAAERFLLSRGYSIR